LKQANSRQRIKAYFFILIVLVSIIIAFSACSIKTPRQYMGESSETTGKTKIAKTVSLSINCKSLLTNIEKTDKSVIDIIPKYGVILSVTSISLAKDGDTVYDALIKIAKERSLIISAKGSGDSTYISGINGIKEFNCGSLSGWKYKVNGKFPGVGVGGYTPEDGDIIEFVYSCDLGNGISEE